MIKAASITLFLAVVALVSLGLVTLTSVKWDAASGESSYVIKQAIWLGVGLLVMGAMTWFDYRWFERYAWPLFGLVCVALGLCYLPGIGVEAKGESRWIMMPVIGRFQPSEPAKLIVMIALAAWFAKYQAETRTLLRGFIYPSLILGVPLLLILFETDMGTAAGLGGAGLIVLFVSGTRARYLVPSIVATVFAGWQMVKLDPVRLGRITAFLDPDKYKEGAAWQQWLAIRAFGNGGMYGMGLGNGHVKQQNFPEHHTDFIFPVIGEELGVFVSMGVVLCFVVIFVMGLGISMMASDRFGGVLALGVSSALVIPAMMNIGVTTSSLPNSGLPLPFVSYGGSSLVFSFAMVGVLFSILRRSTDRDLTEMPAVKQRVLEVKL